jgi:magnesium transporter
MIRSLYRNRTGKIRTDLKPEEFAHALQDPHGLLWVDFAATPPQEDAPILLDTFGFHPLAVDDALQESHIPKVDDWGDYLYIALHAVVFDRDAADDDHVDTLELDVFLGKHYLVTHHDQPIAAVDRVWNGWQRDERHLKGGADHLLYELADGVVADYMTVVDEIDEAIDRLEDEVFDKPTSHTLERIFRIKRAVLNLRRVISPQREVLNKLARDDYPVIDAKDRVYFRDVYDHLVRLYDINESLRDLVGGALDTYLSVINNRMNEIMKTLTIVTTLFMPISFAAGFFGMNFFQPVEDSLRGWSTSPTFILAVLVMIAAPVGMYLWIRRKGWM